MRFKIIYILIRVMRVFARCFYIFPVKRNRVVVSSYKGVHYNCNPRCVAEALCADVRRNYEIIYALRDPEKYAGIIMDGISVVKYRSLGHIFYLMTASIIIENVGGLAAMLPYRRQQKFINTWHGGGATKATGTASRASAEKSADIYSISGKNVNVFLSSSRLFTETTGPSHDIPVQRFVKTGMPRNDIFFAEPSLREDIKASVRKELGIKCDAAVLLYAPTYRNWGKLSIEDCGSEQLSLSALLPVLQERFHREFVPLYRAHTNMQSQINDPRWINVSSYPDMQKLLCVADVLITDYSSCQWDFALQGKPGFLFAGDYDYFEKHNDFFTGAIRWPYRMAKSNEELLDLIRDYNDEENASRIESYYRAADSYENGAATKWVLDYIYSNTKDGKHEKK